MASSWQASLLVASSWNASELVGRAMALAARVSGNAKPLAEKKQPDSLNYFGWCTWDAFYSSVSAMGIQEGLRSLNSGGIKPRTLIIDDGWQLTEVDEDFQEAFSTKALRKMHMPATETIDEDFTVADKNMLSSFADKVGGSSDLATSMPELSDPEYTEAMRRASREKERRRSLDDGEVASTPRSPDETVPKNTMMPDISETVKQISKQPKNTTLWSRLVQRLAGWAVGFVQVVCLTFYQNFVDAAKPHSYFVYFWEYLASGPMRWNILQFYKVSGDFTRRIVSVKANGKFAGPACGSDAQSIAESHELKGVTDHLRREFGVGYIYCWHGLPGYWGGVMPRSPELDRHNPRVVYPKPTPGLLEIEPTLRWNPAVLAGVGIVDNAHALYSEMHRYLAEGGIDGVKVDCQAGVGLLGSVAGGGPALANEYHTALEDSISRHLRGNHIINCMCHSTENLYQMRDSAIVRASDDFYPREPASTLPHIAACAYNSLFLAELAQPDWDMFQSKHPGAHIHACARAVSGGAVYVSDKPGKHDFELLQKLVLRDGSILRALRPGKPTKDCLFIDPLCDGKSLLKVWTNNAYSGFVGIFNLQGSSWDRNRRAFHTHDKVPPVLTTQCRPADVESLEQLQRACPGELTGRVASFKHQSNTLRLLPGLWDAMDIEVKAEAADLVTFVPTSMLGGVEFAPLGFASMLNTGGAVTSWSAGKDVGQQAVDVLRHAANGNGSRAQDTCFEIALRGEGDFIAFSNAAPLVVVLDGATVDDNLITYDGESGRIGVSVTASETESVEHVLHFLFPTA